MARGMGSLAMTPSAPFILLNQQTKASSAHIHADIGCTMECIKAFLGKKKQRRQPPKGTDKGREGRGLAANRTLLPYKAMALRWRWIGFCLPRVSAVRMDSDENKR